MKLHFLLPAHLCRPAVLFLFAGIMAFVSFGANGQQVPSLETVTKPVAQFKSSLDSLKPDSILSKKLNIDKLAGSKLKALKEGLGKLKGDSLKRSPIAYDFSLDNKVRIQPSVPGRNGLTVFNNLTAEATLQWMGIPLHVGYTSLLTNSNSGSGPRAGNLFRFNFDKQRFSALSGQLDQYKNFKSLIPSLPGPDFAKNLVKDKLNGMKDGIGSNLAISNYLTAPANLNSLLQLDEASLKDKLYEELSSFTAKAKDSVSSLVSTGKVTGLLEKKGALEKGALSIKGKADSIFALTRDAKAAYQLIPGLKEQVDSAYAVISSLKKDLVESGIDPQALLSIGTDLYNGTVAYDKIQALIPDQTPAGKFIRKAFSTVSDLKAGSFGNKVPGGQFNPEQFGRGMHLSLKKLSMLTVGFANIRDVSAQKDASFSSSVYSWPKNLTYASIRTNSSLFMNGKFAWVNAAASRNSNRDYSPATLSRNNMSFTFTQALNLGTGGNLAFDLSKSASLFNNTFLSETDEILKDRNSMSYYFRNESYQTLSIGVTHTSDIKKLNMSDDVYFSYAGSGYQNPAAAGFGMGRMKMGGSLKKKMFRNKLTFNARTDLQNTPLGINGSDQWKNYQVQFDGRYQLKKNYTVAVKYMANGTDKMAASVRTPMYSSQKMQFDGSARYRIGQWFGSSYLIAAQQNMDLPSASAAAARLTMVNYSQQVIMKKTSLSANVFYNKENSALKLVGDLLNSDVSFQYTLFKKISASTSATFLYNQDIAKQAGIKQSIQLLAAKSFDVSANLDVRKNMISSLYPVLYPKSRGELFIKYYLKN